MRPIVRLVATALVVASAIVLTGCGSDTSEKPSSNGAQRGAASLLLGVELCVGGGYQLGWTVRFDHAVTPPGNGPFRTQDNHCGQASSKSADDARVDLIAHLYRADGSMFASVKGMNLHLLAPALSVTCRDVSSGETSFKKFSEGESKSFDCPSERIFATRESDSEEYEVFRLSVYPI